MATFAIKPFDRRAKKYSIADEQLLEAAQRVREGNAYAALGGGILRRASREKAKAAPAASGPLHANRQNHNIFQCLSEKQKGEPE